MVMIFFVQIWPTSEVVLSVVKYFVQFMTKLMSTTETLQTKFFLFFFFFSQIPSNDILLLGKKEFKIAGRWGENSKDTLSLRPGEEEEEEEEEEGEKKEEENEEREEEKKNVR